MNSRVTEGQDVVFYTKFFKELSNTFTKIGVDISTDTSFNMLMTL